MWNFLSRVIFRYRILFIILFVGVTAFMLYSAFNVRLAYSMTKLLPSNHQISIDFENFKNKYGENNFLIIAVEDNDFQKLDHIKTWAKISDSIKLIEGVEQLISITEFPILIKNDRKFETHEWFNNNIDSQEILDSAYNIYLSQPFYQKLINTDLDNVITLIVKLNNDFVISSKRNELIFSIKKYLTHILANTILKHIIPDYLTYEL